MTDQANPMPLEDRMAEAERLLKHHIQQAEIHAKNIEISTRRSMDATALTHEILELKSRLGDVTGRLDMAEKHIASLAKPS